MPALLSFAVASLGRGRNGAYDGEIHGYGQYSTSLKDDDGGLGRCYWRTGEYSPSSPSQGGRASSLGLAGIDRG
jgi:hypothetical protein